MFFALFFPLGIDVATWPYVRSTQLRRSQEPTRNPGRREEGHSSSGASAVASGRWPADTHRIGNLVIRTTETNGRAGPIECSSKSRRRTASTQPAHPKGEPAIRTSKGWEFIPLPRQHQQFEFQLSPGPHCYWGMTPTGLESIQLFLVWYHHLMLPAVTVAINTRRPTRKQITHREATVTIVEACASLACFLWALIYLPVARQTPRLWQRRSCPVSAEIALTSLWT
ncbi:hypothetical protein B0H63DRAFT_486587 [Podospora didyma]|uniref:Uncharacterized protein n=1 Tax=Podospora didyma TaxID=330526 RepID=A0AAE0K5Y8_9PEZI|nr:hypothetical protein B0H63DRAFT_486587 [Podospora didyma]